MLKSKRNGKSHDDINLKMLEAMKGGPAVKDPPDPGQADQAAAPAAGPGPVVADPRAALTTEPSRDQANSAPVWKLTTNKKAKSTIVPCIIIDKYNHWHGGAKVDLKGRDTTAFTWGYYGTQYPVLVEQKDGLLIPFYLPDSAGESSNRLYKGAHPDGFKATFKHKSSILQKIQIGLMVGLVIGIFVLIYILINQHPHSSNQPGLESDNQPRANLIVKGESLNVWD